MKVVSLISTALAATLLVGAAGARAQAYPDHQIHMVVAYAPGGAVDAVARKLGVLLSQNLGQQVVVENRPGASGNIGGEYVSKAAPDGYTILFAPSTLLANPLVMKAKPPFDMTRDLTPISLVASGPLLMVVAPTGPATVAEFVAKAKARPDQFNFGTGGFGSAPHLASELFKQRTGLANVPVVLYRGSAPALTDVMSGQLSAMMEPMLTAAPQVRGGKLRALAITSTQRDPQFPNVPTLAEAGFPDMAISTWYGVWGPANLPDALRQRLADAQKTVLGSAEFKTWAAQQGYEPTPVSGAAFAAFLHTESKRYEAIVRDGNIQPQ